MRIYVKNIPAKFRPDPIWNDWALDFLPRDALVHSAVMLQ